MLVGIVIDLACWAPEELARPEVARAAGQLLRGVRKNGVLVCEAADRYVAGMVERVSLCDAPQAQGVRTEVAELAKNRRERTCQPPSSEFQEDGILRLCELARALRPDLIVCRSEADAQELKRFVPDCVEVCPMESYPGSTIECRRDRWEGSQRLDVLARRDFEEVLGRAVAYGREITVVDRYIGKSAKEWPAKTHLRDYARAITFVAEQWVKYSPLARYGKPDFRVVSVGGDTGRSAGFVDLESTRRKVAQVVQSLDREGVVGELRVVLKRDTSPKTILNRYLSSAGRCWGVLHRIDSIGSLAEEPKRAGETTLEPDSEGRRDALAEILSLPDC